MADSGVSEITFEEVQEDLKKNAIILLDVREVKEIQKDGKIPNSVNIPSGEVKEALNLSSEEFEKRYKVKKPSTADKVVLHCHAGKRAVMTTQIASELGYNAFAYKGSFQDWVAKGGPVDH